MGEGVIVKGEVYEVDAAGLRAIDRLEGHPTAYRRSPLSIVPVGAPVQMITAQAYFFHDKRLRRALRHNHVKPISWFTETNQPEPV